MITEQRGSSAPEPSRRQRPDTIRRETPTQPLTPRSRRWVPRAWAAVIDSPTMRSRRRCIDTRGSVFHASVTACPSRQRIRQCARAAG